MKYLALIAILLALFFSVKMMKDRERIEHERQVKESMAPLEVTLDAGSHFVIGSRIPVTIIYRNSSVQTIKVSNQFTNDLSLELAAADLNGLAVEVRPNSAGPAPERPENMVVLDPGQTMQGEVDLNKYFKFADGATYVITAIYHGLGEPGPRSKPVRVVLDWPK